jgi:membrane-bound lytic murein transglycosylase A
MDNQGQIRFWIPFGRWVVIQDSGGAIRGPSRIDLFWGEGAEAETAAGHLRHEGAFFLLLKKETASGS